MTPKLTQEKVRPGAPVQGEAGVVLGEDPGLDGPHPGSVGGLDEGLQQRGSDALPGVAGVDVDAVLDDAGVDAAPRDGRRCNPPGDLPTWGEGDDAVLR